MAKLEEINIKGIRSYSTSRVSRIEFEDNLNIIHGKNGSGKTTILECLRLIFTGNFPSGTKISSFLNDTKYLQLQQTKASIELGFRDRNNDQFRALKSFQSSYKNNKLETKTLESRLEKAENTTKKRNMTTRSSDFVNEIITLTGVTAPIMDFVIFCHHDDSTWPLSDPKNLKDKLDSIFATTLYNKALESIRSIRKSKAQCVNEMQPAIKQLKEVDDKTKELSKRVISLKSEMSLKRKTGEDLKDKTTIMKINLDELLLIKEQIDTLKKQIDRFNLINENISNEISTIRISKNLKNYENIDIYLELEISTNKQIEINKELELFDKNQDELMNQINKLMEVLNKKSSKYDRYKIRLENFYYRLNTNKYFKDKILPNETIEKINKLLKDSLEELKAKYDNDMILLEKEINISNNNINIKRNELENNNINIGNLTHSMDIKKNLIIQINDKLKSIKLKIQKFQFESLEIQKMNSKMLEYSKSLESYENINISSIDEQITTIDNAIKHREENFNNYHLKFENLNNMMQVAKNNETNFQLIIEKRNNLNKILDKYKEIISKIFSVQTNLSIEYISKLSFQAKSEITSLEKKISKNLYVTASKENEKNINAKTIIEKKSELESLNIIISNAKENNIQINNKDLDEIQNVIDKSSNKIIKNHTLHRFNKKYISSILSKNVCPMCEENINNEENIIHNIECKSRKYIKYIHKYQKIKTENIKMLKDKVVNNENYEKIVKIKKEIELICNDIAKLESRNNELSNEIHSNKNELSQLNKNKVELNEAILNFKICEKNMLEIIEFEKNHNDSIESSKDINDKIISIKDEIKKMKELDQKECKIRESNRNRINEINKSKLDLSNRMLEIQKKLSSMQCDSDYLNELTMEEKELLANLETVKMEINNLIKNLEEEKSKSRTSKREIDELNQILKRHMKSKEEISLNIRGSINIIEKFIEESEMLKNDNIYDKIEKYSKKISKLNTNIENLKSNIKSNANLKSEFQIKLNEIINTIDDLKLYQLYIEKNKQIEDNLFKIKALKLKINDISNNIDIEKQIETINNEIIQLKYQMKMIDGSLLELEKQVNNLENDLNCPPFLNSNEKYLKKLTEVQVTNMIINDMDQYYSAFDFAISKYHSDKIEEINRRIKAFWEIAYKSDDIDTIKLCAEIDDSAVVKQKRSYNYRVLMVKDGIETDMRGRCSSGQKMIACIIIRLALFNAFCSTCSFIALDEPTTNLDENNLQGLADSLRKLTSHEKFRKFQLIVITHDESFLRYLCHDQDIRNYFDVCKDKDGYSVITKKDISKIFS